MKLYQNINRIMATGTLISSSLFLGCDLSQSQVKTLEGTVKEEFGTTNMLLKSSGAMFGNESVKIGAPNYGLILSTREGEYNLQIYEQHKPILALAKAIEQGDLIKIDYYPQGLKLNGRISNDRIGWVSSDSVELLEKGNKKEI